MATHRTNVLTLGLGPLFHQDQSECVVCYLLDDAPHGHDTTQSTPHLHKVNRLCLWDPIPLRLPERALKGRGVKRAPPTEAAATRTVSSLVFLLRFICEIFSLCTDLCRGMTAEWQKRLFWVVGPLVPSTEKPKAERESGALTSHECLQDWAGEQRIQETAPCKTGEPPAMAASHSVEKERCQEVKSSAGEQVIRCPKATYYPPPTSTQPLPPRTNTRLALSSFVPSNH